MKNLRISFQLILLIGGLMAAFAAATYLQVRSSTETIYQQRYELLRTQVESALSVMKDYNDRAAAGEFSVEEAQKLAYGQVGRPVCYMFEGSFGGAMRFVMEQAGRAAEPTCREVACAAHGASECRFELRCDPV